MATTSRGATGAARSSMMPADDDNTQTRFLREMSLRLPFDRVVEAHVFPPIRQGGAETGVAVIAVKQEAAVGGGPSEVGEEGDRPAPLATDASADEQQATETQPSESPTADRPPPTGLPDRYTVFSARYRLTLKGPDRGKWEVDVVEEADAPLVTVAAVVRGVQRRGGEGADAERFTAEQLRALLEEPAAP